MTAVTVTTKGRLRAVPERRTCEYTKCGATFTVPSASWKTRFCSMSCASRGRAKPAAAKTRGDDFPPEPRYTRRQRAMFEHALAHLEEHGTATTADLIDACGGHADDLHGLKKYLKESPLAKRIEERIEVIHAETGRQLHDRFRGHWRWVEPS